MCVVWTSSTIRIHGQEPPVSNAPAIWSAVAATLVAVTSLLTWLNQRRGLLESARPELALLDWRREKRGTGDSAHEVLHVRSVKNVGRGPAFHVVPYSQQVWENKPVATMSSPRMGVLGAGEEALLNAEIVMWWKNVKDGQGYLLLEVSLLCWDRIGRRHITTYEMAVSRDHCLGPPNDYIAPGITFGTRRTVTRSVWLLKLEKRLSRIPLLRKLVPQGDLDPFGASKWTNPVSSSAAETSKKS